MADHDSFGAFLVKQRTDRSLSRRDFANALQISQSHLGNLENDNTKPSADLLTRMAAYLQVNLGDLHHHAGVAIPTVPLSAMTFGAWIKGCRHIINLTQAEVAQQMGVSESYISYLESGRKPLAQKRARQLAAILQIDVQELLDRAGVIDDKQLAQIAMEEPETTGMLLRRLPTLTTEERARAAAFIAALGSAER